MSAEKQVILFASADPKGTDDDELRPTDEAKFIDETLRATSYRDQFDFRPTWGVTLEGLMKSLNRLRPVILHFTGHGSGTASGLVLEGEFGRQIIDGAAMAKLVAAAGAELRVVLLSSCNSLGASGDTQNRPVIDS